MTLQANDMLACEKDDDDIPVNCISNVSVDNIIFAMEQSKLKVLLVKYNEGISAGKWALLGHWLREGEDLAVGAARVVREITGVDNLYLEQLKAFGKVNRYPNRRILTIAYYSLVLLQDVDLQPQDKNVEFKWFDIHQLPELVFDHLEIVQTGLEKLQYRVRHEPIGFSLLPEKFTLLQLQEIYEAILNQKLDKPNFRRKFQKMNLLIDCKEKQQNVAHRAAGLYRFDIEVYKKLKDFGFNFDF